MILKFAFLVQLEGFEDEIGTKWSFERKRIEAVVLVGQFAAPKGKNMLLWPRVLRSRGARKLKPRLQNTKQSSRLAEPSKPRCEKSESTALRFRVSENPVGEKAILPSIMD
ncbi:hypothetical protein TIFTF001_004493 [Ficus carica]|uniref:Uncharacterized protein n=1 Tax=Ficus carica TaxID=3494 RepID=A0AA87ZL00_FICCA|nr:hypothetical protein TIFTF001_004493 [Ficus carica]